MDDGEMNRNTWIIIIVTVIVIIGLIWIFNRGPVATSPLVTTAPTISTGDPPSTDKTGDIIVTIAPFISKDTQTGCQYVYGIGIGITPRMGADGKQICGALQ